MKKLFILFLFFFSCSSTELKLITPDIRLPTCLLEELNLVEIKSEEDLKNNYISALSYIKKQNECLENWQEFIDNYNKKNLN